MEVPLSLFYSKEISFDKFIWKNFHTLKNIAALGSILDSQQSWKSSKFQLARWSHNVALFWWNHPPSQPPTRSPSFFSWEASLSSGILSYSLTHSSSILPRSPKLIFLTGNEIIQSGNGIIPSTSRLARWSQKPALFWWNHPPAAHLF